ncbi:hypothetical protein [Kamptonema formosum]|uniref:hypothetical protein n=1 Tax=Kamptonema formosum TaxID=331992 RepID=UPI0018E28482|nr:hypothetical protein [Oscillatoria sp. PCC 10802]
MPLAPTPEPVSILLESPASGDRQASGGRLPTLLMPQGVALIDLLVDGPTGVPDSLVCRFASRLSVERPFEI